MESLQFIQWCLDNLNYGTITLLMAIESSFIPLPSEIVIPPAAYMAAEGKMNVFLVVLSGTVGSMIGAMFNYTLAYFLGRPVIYKLANSRVGRMCLLNEHKVQKAEGFFVKNGAISTFIGRLIPGIRHLISIPAGLAKMKISTFLFYTALGSCIWSSILAIIGYSLQSFVPRDQLMDKVYFYRSEIVIGFLLFTALLILYFVYKGKVKSKKSHEVN